MPVIYQTQIEEVGAQVNSFLDSGMFILFGSGAPEALKEYCYIVDIVASTGEIEPGQRLMLGDRPFKITAVGSVARKNLEGLGHITVVFNGSTTADMQGSVYVEAGAPPELSVGTVIAIEL